MSEDEAKRRLIEIMVALREDAYSERFASKELIDRTLGDLRELRRLRGELKASPRRHP